MTLTTRTPLIIAALVAALVGGLFALSAGPAEAIVPPKDCKIITVGGKRYNIKSDQIKCTTAREYATKYLRTRDAPRSWKCYRYTGSKLVFRCVNTRSTPDKTIWAYKK